MDDETLPITISADESFSTALTPLLHKLEMWINFQALKANWYGDEACVLTFHYTIVRTLAEKASEMSEAEWQVDQGFAYHYHSDTLTTQAFIAIADLVQQKTGIEQAIKSRLTRVANAIAKQHDLTIIA
jgi:hypothetical protein